MPSPRPFSFGRMRWHAAVGLFAWSMALLIALAAPAWQVALAPALRGGGILLALAALPLAWCSRSGAGLLLGAALLGGALLDLAALLQPALAEACRLAARLHGVLGLLLALSPGAISLTPARFGIPLLAATFAIPASLLWAMCSGLAPWITLICAGLLPFGVLALGLTAWRNPTAPAACRRDLLAAALALATAQACALGVGGVPTMLALLFDSLFLLGAVHAALVLRQRRLAEQARCLPRAEAAALRALAAGQRAAQEDERRRLASLMQDDLGQLLGAMANEVALLRLRGGAEESCARLEAALQPAIAQLRRSAAALRPQALEDGGLYFALAELARQFCQRHGIACELEAQEADLHLDEARAVALYRIAEAALDNVQRHARARHVRLLAQRSEGGLLLAIADDGRGLPPQAKHERFGIADMRARAAALGGELSLARRAGGGTCVRAWLPGPAQAAQ